MNTVQHVSKLMDQAQGPAPVPAPAETVPAAAPQLTVEQIQAIAQAVKGELQGDAKPWYTSRLVALGIATAISSHVPFLASIIKSNIEIFATVIGTGIVALRSVTTKKISAK